MGEVSTLHQNTIKKNKYLKTIIPNAIINQMKLKPGDMFDWSFISLKGEIALVVKKIKG